ncbi:MAG: hypothetical protein ACI9TH_004680 [Kiritimatiellia bacterium]|jgi:hypothetical protein
MRIVLQRQTLDRDGFVLRVVLPLLIVLALALTTLVPQPFVPACNFKTLTGMPCGGCGTFRGLGLLARGDIVSAWTMQPLIIGACLVAAAYAMYTFVASLLRWPQIGVAQWTARNTAWVISFAVFAYVANWGYLIFDGR